MKNKNQERLARLQRQYHRKRPCHLDDLGLDYSGVFQPRLLIGLSWAVELGFILNGRRVMLYWSHPRSVYAEALDDQARKDMGPGPSTDWNRESTPRYVPAGASRKRIVSYTSKGPSEAELQHWRAVNDHRAELEKIGIDYAVQPSIKVHRWDWAIGVDLVVPMEVETIEDAEALAKLARRLLKRETTVTAEFPGYVYTREDWLRDQATLNAQEPTEESP